MASPALSGEAVAKIPSAYPAVRTRDTRSIKELVLVALPGAQETQNYMTLPKWYLDCDKCRAHADSEPFLLEAFASVGIEHGKSSGQMAEEYFVHFHRNGHKAEGPKVLKPE